MSARLMPYSEYKDSSLPSLGRIPVHWAKRRAKYFFREADERSRTGQEELLSVSHLTGVSPRSQKSVTMFMAESYVGHKVCQAGDLVINTMWAWMAALGVARQTGIVSPSYAVYRPIRSGALSPDFIDRLLRIHPYAAEYVCRSTGIRSSRLRLYPEKFLEIPIVCPPYEEQNQIVAYLKAKDQLIRRFIRAKRRLIELLNKQKRTIIQRAVTRGLDPSVRLKPSGVSWLGDIPEHWEVVPLKRIAWFKGGAGFPVHEQGSADPEFPFLKVSDMTRSGNERWMDAAGNTVSRHTAQRLGAYVFPTNSIVFPKVGGALLTNKRRLLRRPSCIDNNMMGCVVRRGVLEYIFLLLQQLDLGRLSKPGPVPALGEGEVREIKVAFPPEDEQPALVESVRKETTSFDTAIERADCEITLLREYRTRLLFEVITGKLDVRGVERPQLEEEEEPSPVGDETAEEATEEGDDLEPAEDA